MKLIVGLGNPGSKYKGTRHNIGAEIIDHLIKKEGSRLKRKWKINAFTGKVRIGDSIVTVAKPRSFMNLSGNVVARLVKWENCVPEDLLVISDDINLELGCIRIRKRGSSGGHNGLESIIASLGTQDFPRLRIGVGGASRDWVRHVLGAFSGAEREKIEYVKNMAMEAIEEIVAHGLDSAMNRFNPTDK